MLIVEVGRRKVRDESLLILAIVILGRGRDGRVHLKPSFRKDSDLFSYASFRETFFVSTC